MFAVIFGSSFLAAAMTWPTLRNPTQTIEHNLGEVLRICERLVVLDNGRRIAEGAPQAVMADPSVRAAYLGEGADHAAA